MKTYKSLLLTLIAVYISSCSYFSYEGVYKEPYYEKSKEYFSIILDKNFDEVWNKLIEYSAGAFFSIDNFEKASGLITLTFGTSNPSDFVTGGYFYLKSTFYDNVLFEGDYINYHSATLIGKMNIFVMKISENKTKVNIHARYIINMGGSTTHVIESGGYKTFKAPYSPDGISPYRTICPTYKAENAIIEALKY